MASLTGTNRAPYRFQLTPPKLRQVSEPVLKQLAWKTQEPDAKTASSDRLWCAKAAGIADEHLKSAFAGLKEALRAFRAETMEKSRRSRRSLPVVLALAGTSSSDHRATMCRLRELLHSEVPNVCTALVRPNDFTSLAAANRRISEQLTSDKSGQPPEVEGDEDDEEIGAAASFLSGRANTTCMTVLCIEAADAVAKDVLGDVLAYWHVNCVAAGIPVVAVLGLKRLKASRAELFDLGGEPGAIRHVQTVCLFDPTKVFQQLQGQMKQVASCPISRIPEARKLLREIFQLRQQSVSHVLQTVCLLAAKNFDSGEESLDDVERHLLTKAEGKLRMFAAEEPHDVASTKEAGSPLRDAARIYQYLECSAGKQIKVADIWAAWQANLFAPSSDKAVTRFQHALTTLHFLGIASFVRGNAQKGMSGWHLKKRVFGRVWWYKEIPTRAQVQRARSFSSQASEASSQTPPRQERSWSMETPSPLKPSLEPGPGMLLKRLPHARVYDIEEDEFVPQKKQRRSKIIHGPIDVN